MTNFTDILLDRDGTVIHDRHYLADPEGVELLPGVGEALALLAGRGARFFLVSNQSGVGRGLFTEERVLACNARLAELLAPYGVAFTASLFCPHAPDVPCACRKPATGMWSDLRRRFGLAPEYCAMVGDKTDDMAFASGAGLGARVLTLTGKGRETAKRLQLPSGSFLPGPGEGLWLNPGLAGPEYPQAVIRGFEFLPEALGALAGAQGPADPTGALCFAGLADNPAAGGGARGRNNGGDGA